MLYIVSKDDKVLGTPFIVENLEQAHQKMIVQQKDKLAELEDIFNHNVEVRTMEIKKQIVACENIIDTEKESKDTSKETKETAKQAVKFKANFEKDIAKITKDIRAEVDVLVATWTYEIDDLEFYEISPLDKKTK